jgi:hypothetical protein
LASIILAGHMPTTAAAITPALQARGHDVKTASEDEVASDGARPPAAIVVSPVTVGGLALAQNLSGSRTPVVLFSPFPIELLHRIPGFATTTAVYVDIRPGVRTLVEAICGLADSRATRGGNASEEKGWGHDVALRVGMTLKNVEAVIIAETLRYTTGNVTAAARILAVDRTTLYNKIGRHGIVRILPRSDRPAARDR